MTNKPRVAAASSLLALAALFLYFVPDSRLDDGALQFAEATLLEIAMIMTVVVAILAVWLYGVVQLALSRRWWLLALALIAWPASHAYLIFREPNAC